MQNDAISYNPTHRMCLLREPFVRLLDYDHCCAAILALLEYLVNRERSLGGPRNPWIRMSSREIEENLMRLYRNGTISDALAKLEQLGYIERRTSKNRHYIRLLGERVTEDLAAKGLQGPSAVDSIVFYEPGGQFIERHFDPETARFQKRTGCEEPPRRNGEQKAKKKSRVCAISGHARDDNNMQTDQQDCAKSHNLPPEFVRFRDMLEGRTKPNPQVFQQDAEPPYIEVYKNIRSKPHCYRNVLEEGSLDLYRDNICENRTFSGTSSVLISEKSGIQTPVAGSVGEEYISPEPAAGSGDVADDGGEEPLVEFLRNAWRRVRQQRIKLHRKQDQPILERCVALEGALGKQEFRGRILKFLEEDSPYLRRNKWPILLAIKQIEAETGGASRRTTINGSPYIPSQDPATSGSRNKNGNSSHRQFAPTVSAERTPPKEVELWHELVPSGPRVERWTTQDEKIERYLQDPVFQKNIRLIFERCEAAHAARGKECSWMSFRWLFRRADNGNQNWYRVLNGEMAWAEGPKTQKRTAQPLNPREEIQEIDEERLYPEFSRKQPSPPPKPVQEVNEEEIYPEL